jgi:hypothetical protein
MPRAKPKSRPRTKAKTKPELSKFQRYRRAQSRRGMKLLRMWVPDPNTPEFQREAKRQGAILRHSKAEAEATRFIEAAFEWPSE